MYYQPPPVRPTSGLAVTGFILSLVWLCGLGSIAAVIMCGLAYKDTSNGVRGGHGLTIAGLIIGAVGIVGASFIVLPFIVAGLALPGDPTP